MQTYRTIEFHKGRLKFRAGHFTIFSATQRERLHGHNYDLEASITAAIGAPGITFDYRIFGDKLAVLCKQLDLFFLLPGNSPFLLIEEQGDYFHATFNSQKMFFLKEDVLILPLANITLEELSSWFIQQISEDKDLISQHSIQEIQIRVFNGPEHSAKAQWQS